MPLRLRGGQEGPRRRHRAARPCVALGDKARVKLGEETVLYRHEKTFVNQTALAVNINDTDSPDAIDATLKAVTTTSSMRVGQELRIDLVAVTQNGARRRCLRRPGRQGLSQATNRPLVLRSNDAAALTAAAVAVKGTRSLICSPAADAAQQLATVAKDNGHALAITAPDLDSLAALAESIKQSGFNDLFLQFQTFSLAEQFQTNSIARRAALKNAFKAPGYPTLRFIELGRHARRRRQATTEINKYGGICVLPAFDPALLASLMTLRLNIYTDPQKPIQVEPKVYPIGEPEPDSPVFVTTNFSLTYFIVSGEIENSGITAWLLVPECEGLSVLTAWAAGKFSGATIGKFAKEIGLDAQVTAAPDHHPRLRRPDQRRTGGDPARLEGPRRPPGGRRPRKLHQGPVGRLTDVVRAGCDVTALRAVESGRAAPNSDWRLRKGSAARPEGVPAVEWPADGWFCAYRQRGRIR